MEVHGSGLVLIVMLVVMVDSGHGTLSNGNGGNGGNGAWEQLMVLR